jgi:hypothetical protein
VDAMGTVVQPPVESISRKLDVQPILARTAESFWSRAESIRDHLYASATKICEQENVDGLVLMSDPFVHPAWVKFECWIRQGHTSLTERALVIVEIQPKPWHRFEFEYNVKLEDRGTTTTYNRLSAFDAEMLSSVMRYLLRRAPEPRLAAYKLRSFDWQLWRAKNEVNAVHWDVLGTFLNLLILVGFIGLFLIPVGWLLTVIGAAAYYASSKRTVQVRSTTKPPSEPRSLVRIDSWQAVVFGLGKDAARFREQFLASLSSPSIKNLRHSVEHIWHWGLDGKVEREQIVLGFERSLVFCQIHAYDDDLYVGWDGHLNVGQWVEQTVARGIDRSAGSLVEVKTLEAGVQNVSEYDVHDAGCLMEWAHARLSQQIKRLMEERKIDQEIDFKVLRGERQGLTKERADDGSGLGGLIGKLRRTG